jgi:hypothetical protein
VLVILITDIVDITEEIAVSPFHGSKAFGLEVNRLILESLERE